MSPARHTTHNPHHGLGSRLGWREISTGGTTPMPDSARAESGARADWQACTTHTFLLDHRTSCTVFRAIVVFAMIDNHGSFVYDSPNLFCGPSGSVRTRLTGVRSEPGHRTHLTSLLQIGIASTKCIYCLKKKKEVIASEFHGASQTRSDYFFCIRAP